jgi:peroxiredoxin
MGGVSSSGNETGKAITPGNEIPSVVLDHGFNPIQKVNLAERMKGRNVIIMGLPGAFTPC